MQSVEIMKEPNVAAYNDGLSRPSWEVFLQCVQSFCTAFNVSTLQERQLRALFSFVVPIVVDRPTLTCMYVRVFNSLNESFCSQFSMKWAVSPVKFSFNAGIYFLLNAIYDFGGFAWLSLVLFCINYAKLSTRGLRHQDGISSCKSQTSLLRNDPRGAGAMRGGCIRRLKEAIRLCFLKALKVSEHSFRSLQLVMLLSGR